MAITRIAETTTKRVAYGLMITWLVMVVLGLFDRSFFVAAGPLGFAAGIWIGRLTEARQKAKGQGVILGE